jgi:predicted outer membrane repeat protein
MESSTHITDGTFEYNSGSLYIFNSNLTFSGYTRVENSPEPNKAAPGAREEGGAITSIQSTVIFAGVSSLSNNQARHGGAILATESKIMMYCEITIANNTATVSSGGGISLQQSNLEVKGNCNISGNDAVRGGGIHATSSTIAMHEPGTLQFINNRAKNGSGLYLELNAKLYDIVTVY